MRVFYFSAIFAAVLSLVTPDAHDKQAEPRFSRFGVIEPHDAPQSADVLSVGWGRARFHWAYIQPDGPDQWIDAELSDEELDTELAAGRETVGLLIGIPDWARDSDGLPQGLYLAPDDAGNLWATFVRTIVARYQGRINHWIVWNEPDVWDANHPGYTWSGTEADYVQLLKTAYLVAKEENPNSLIHLAAVSHWWDVQYGHELYFSRLLEAITAEQDAAANNYYYDAATLHLYFSPGSVYEVITQYREIQSSYGLDKPLWLIETNAAPSGDPGWQVPDPTFRVSLLEQAAYQPQGVSLALAAGAERIGIYKLIDTPGDVAANPEPFGLVRADQSERPAFRTAQVAISHLGNADEITWVDQHIVSQVVIEEDDTLTRLLWTRIPQAQQVMLPAISDEAMLIDMWGNEQAISPEAGTYTIILYAGECQETTGDYCMIGGPPVYLVETKPADFDASSLTLAYEPASDIPVVSVQNPMRISALIWFAVGLMAILLAVGGVLVIRRKGI